MDKNANDTITKHSIYANIKIQNSNAYVKFNAWQKYTTIQTSYINVQLNILTTGNISNVFIDIFFCLWTDLKI